MCCWSISLFIPEALAYPGWEYAKKIYRELKSRDALSFEAWRLFQEAFPDQPGQYCGNLIPYYDKCPAADNSVELRHHFRLEMHDVITCWSFLVKNLSTLDTNVLTHFCANGLTLDLAKLISLTAIPTLTALIHVNSSQRQTHPLTGIAIRDWCRAVAEKNAFPKLKLLYLGSILDNWPPDSSLLGHLSSFPALALVGVERATSPPMIDVSGPCGQWQRSSAEREHELSETMHDTQTTIAEKAKALYKHACKASKLKLEDTSGVPDIEPPIRLILSCYASRTTRDACTTTWFVRRHYAPERPPKRLLDAPNDTNSGDRGSKMRKIRKAKHCDMGTLLDSFGPPLANDLEDSHADQS